MAAVQRPAVDPPTAGPCHDLRIGDRVRAPQCIIREDGTDGGALIAGGTVTALYPSTPRLPAGVAVVAPDGASEPIQIDVRALLHDDGRPASAMPLWTPDPPPPLARSRLNALMREGAAGCDAETRLRWARLLAAARRADRGLGLTLAALRRRGAALEATATGGRLGSGAMPPAEYEAIRARHLVPVGDVLAGLLGRLDDEP
jgi:hypothetical protein